MATHPMLSKRHLNTIVSLVNDQVNIPLLSEKTEAQLLRTVLTPAIRQILKLLSTLVPPGYLDLALNTRSGVHPTMERSTKRFLKKLVVSKLPRIKFLPPRVVRRMVGKIIDIVATSMLKGKSLSTVTR